MKPILFSTPMVQAILKGQKRQTRRVVKPPKKSTDMPPHRPGDILWVRETWQHTKILNLHPSDEDYGYVYRADGGDWEYIDGWKWRPSIFMPKEACRLWLKVTNVRVERLQSISEADAKAEGFDSVDSFFALWQKINGTESLAANPWVWVYEFEVISKPRASEQQYAVIKTCNCEMPAKIHGKNLCWRCKRPLS